MRTFIVLALLFVSGVTHATPIDQNKALSDLAWMFSNETEQPIHKVELLDKQALDYSYASLRYVNQYLDAVRHDELSDEAWYILILRAGAYVGEVIRRNDKKNPWRWLDYEAAKSINPKFFEQYGYVIGTAAVLNDGGDGFIFPLAKVEKYLLNGSEDDLFFYARVITRME